MFKNVLIANRGEIALRIIRACKELGIKTTVIYSKPDKDSLAVKFADKKYNLGKPEAYLDIKKIVKIAKKAKVDAIHPGYGFLSENTEFAKLCEQNKIKLIGPSSRAMAMMGDKSQARATMIKAGIPVIKGIKDMLKDINHAKEVSKQIGYPVIIKAVAGGGGRGMRVVSKEEDIESAYNAAKTEAASAFGNDSLYIEKYVEDPRHIEFQILADRYGNVIHLAERDCSIQRRHQKLIEEAPSPALSNKMREEMGRIAVHAAEVVGYEGAGTVEFLLDKNNKYYFMEMNTRIQVEHGVTELITGVDLIKEQIKIAAGAKLTSKQEDIIISGWAIECRINAESPTEFLPSNGTITNYLVPGGPGIRICSCSHSGHRITPHYDSMISKLMVRGKDREEAISRMSRALDEYIIEGVETTIPFHKAVIRNRYFISGKVTTSFIDKHNIISQVKNYTNGKRKLTKKEKLVIVSTAVSKYLSENKVPSQQPNEWVMAGRRELMEHEGN
ncbi:MAG: acetyl-CoA carboxylase biotin carboxylase subunit [Nanoarchaeota archaeon]|nr:acetyl-CoA carboxylase biotin carboxylase subunit [Nanoarchaeota archaeon]MBU1704112.1 acetyl-CoA carboxylase biotin carboxylase subunit [Nanoarchaeota archaeon]